MLRPLIHKALAFRRVSQLEALNHELQNQIGERERAVAKLRESEERFRLLVEGVQDYAIYMLNPQGIVTTWNTGAERIKGYHAAEIVGKHFSCFFSPEDIQTGKPDRALEVAASEGQYQDESLRMRKDGSAFWASILLTALHDNAGKLYGFAKVVRDITERKETEQRLRERDRLAILGTTAAVFAHEIANPLNGLSTSLQFATELISSSDNHDPLLGETIEIAHQEIKRLTSLLNDYRSFAKPHSSKLQPCSLQQVVEEILALSTKQYQNSGIIVERHFERNLPLVAVDRERMKQVILNLCKNAVEAMPEGGTVSFKAYERNGRLVLEVADTGMGMADGFDPFQLFKTTKPYGTGLGLPIAEQIISEHHGTIKYVTEVGKGTTFIVSLPLSSG
jgi:PAS domain S-box-containing protein